MKNSTTKRALMRPDVVFEASWEVCNKVGGIFTVLSSRAKTMVEALSGHVYYIGPDLGQDDECFDQDATLVPEWQAALRDAGLKVRVGRWLVPGRPVALLVDAQPLMAERDAIYAAAWRDFGVDSIKAYGDYDEASMFSEAAGRVAAVCIETLPMATKVVYQAHEWMTGLGMMRLKTRCPHVATVFTTHATSIGRSIAGNNKLLYKYFDGYHGDQMAVELHMDAKHSVEKQAAHHADCFTTVSQLTARECRQLLDRDADVVLPNGFEPDFVPAATPRAALRRKARRAVLDTMKALLGEKLASDVLVVSTSGRNDYRCKGLDVYLEAMAQLGARLDASKGVQVVALVEVPCWTIGPRADLLERLGASKPSGTPLPDPFITHSLHNMGDDRIVATIRSLGLDAGQSPVKVMLVPCYLDGHDGVFNMPYYDLLTASDLCVYPSYYEPWGYTPLESCAFSVPCITTDLSGFGLWANETLGHVGTLADGVAVLHRDDDNYFETASAIADNVQQLLAAPAIERRAMAHKAQRLSQRAQWRQFATHYFDAYDFALRRVVEVAAPAGAEA